VKGGEGRRESQQRPRNNVSRTNVKMIHEIERRRGMKETRDSESPDEIEYRPPSSPTPRKPSDPQLFCWRAVPQSGASDAAKSGGIIINKAPWAHLSDGKGDPRIANPYRCVAAANNGCVWARGSVIPGVAATRRV
jgi:hypothetical protein